MATKKKKHEAAVRKRMEFMAEQKRLGLEAQERAKVAREERLEALKAEVDTINRRHAAILATALIKGRSLETSDNAGS